MSYKIRSRIENEKKYKRAGVINTALAIIGMASLAIGVAIVDLATTAGMALITAGMGEVGIVLHANGAFDE